MYVVKFTKTKKFFFTGKMAKKDFFFMDKVKKKAPPSPLKKQAKK